MELKYHKIPGHISPNLHHYSDNYKDDFNKYNKTNKRIEKNSKYQLMR